MTKTEIYNNVNNELAAILDANKISNKAAEALQAMIDVNLKPKTSSSQHPPLENGDMYCRYTQKYYPEEEMVMSKGKSKGYSKAGIAVWNKVQRTIKKWSSIYVDLDDMHGEQAIELGARIRELKGLSNDPEAFKSGLLEELMSKEDLLEQL